MVQNSSDIAAEASGQFIKNSLIISLRDYYNQIVIFEYSLSEKDVYVISSKPDESTIQGNTVVRSVNGLAVFDDLIISYYPGSVLTLLFELAGIEPLLHNITFR